MVFSFLKVKGKIGNVTHGPLLLVTPVAVPFGPFAEQLEYLRSCSLPHAYCLAACPGLVWGK